MYIKNSFIIPQLVGTKIFYETKDSVKCVNYSLIKILILRMNIILYSYALHTGTYVRNSLKITIRAILLCIKYSSSTKTMLEIYVTWANIRRAFEIRTDSL